MQTFALDSNNDRIIKNGRFEIVKDGAAVAVKVRSRLLFYFKEWYLDNSIGVPYFEEILVKPVDLENAESIIKQVILQTNGVESLTEFSSSFDKDELKLVIDAKVKTIFDSIEEISVNV